MKRFVSSGLFGSELSSRQFSYESSGNYNRISCFEVHKVGDHTPLPGWKILGWCRNERLTHRRNNDMLCSNGAWIAVLYGHEDGRKIWFHEIIDKEIHEIKGKKIIKKA